MGGRWSPSASCGPHCAPGRNIDHVVELLASLPNEDLNGAVVAPRHEHRTIAGRLLPRSVVSGEAARDLKCPAARYTSALKRWIFGRIRIVAALLSGIGIEVAVAFERARVLSITHVRPEATTVR